MSVPEKVRCSINRKWFVNVHHQPCDGGLLSTPVYSWCEAHPKPIALLSAEHEKQHDKEFHV